MKSYIYVCHTYYHVYISILKELARPKEEQGNATIVLSIMTTNFEELKKRLEDTGYFKEVIEFDEQRPEKFPELAKYHVKTGNFIKSLYNRIKFTRLFAKLQEPFIPVDFKKYDEIYVFCDSDPIGYYLNMNHIYYHAVEDGLNTIRNWDLARADNSPHFGLKSFLSKKMNLIFIQNGWARYCIDMEVNDISVLKYPSPYYVEVSRDSLVDRMSDEEKDFLLRIFVRDFDKLKKVLSQKAEKSMIILTEPLSDLETRKRIFTDLSNRYKDEYQIIFKIHPTDLLDYNKEFPEFLNIERTVPMEMLNFLGYKFDLVLSIFTELDNIRFANETLRLGRDFMDDYEDIEIHKARFASR